MVSKIFKVAYYLIFCLFASEAVFASLCVTMSNGDRVVVVCDGRAMRNKVIVSDDHRKLYQIGAGAVVVATGTTEFPLKNGRQFTMNAFMRYFLDEQKISDSTVVDIVYVANLLKDELSHIFNDINFSDQIDSIYLNVCLSGRSSDSILRTSLIKFCAHCYDSGTHSISKGFVADASFGASVFFEITGMTNILDSITPDSCIAYFLRENKEIPLSKEDFLKELLAGKRTSREAVKFGSYLIQLTERVQSKLDSSKRSVGGKITSAIIDKNGIEWSK